MSVLGLPHTLFATVADSPSDLSGGLAQIISKLQDRAYAARLSRVYAAATQTIAKLSDMDLVGYETVVTDESPDLSLWEEMAPVIRDTVMDVNGFLSVIRAEFPQQPSGGLADTLSKAMDEAVGKGGGSPEARRATQAADGLVRAMNQMAAQITELGETMRNPQVVSDRWNLLATIQKYRTLFRQEIGSLVYDSAAAFGEVNRRDVIPGYADDLAAAVSVRSTVADLFRVVTHRQQKVGECEPEDVQWQAQQFEKELDTFGRTRGYKALRAQDKRAFLELRAKVAKAAAKSNPRKDELNGLVAPVLELAKTMQQVNNRTILVQHDRELFAAIGVRLEQAEGALKKNPAGAAQLCSEAVLSAQSLYGRDAALDGFLRKARKTPVTSLPASEVPQTIEELRGLLASVQLAG